MGRKKSQSQLTPLGEILPIELWQGLDSLVDLTIEAEIDSAETQISLGVQQQWEIAAFWIAYEAMPIIDIHRTPYLKPEFKAIRDWAKTLSAHLQLCKGCFELKRPKEYLTPFHWWLECMQEIKNNHFLEALKSPGHAPKAEYIENYKTRFLQDLRKQKIPSMLQDVEHCSANQKLMETAIFLIKKQSSARDFKADYWNPYINTCQRYIVKLRENKMLVGKGIKDNQVYEVIGGHLQKAPDILMVQPETPKWSSQQVYANCQ
jgi:hypothetical protein